MVDKAPAENAPAAEGARTNNVYTTPIGYQYCETLAITHKKGGRVKILGTRRYMTGVPWAWGGYNGLPHSPDPKKGPPPSRETFLRRLGLSQEETMYFKGPWKVEPFQIYSDWCLEEEKCMPFPAGAAWSGFKEELPSLESWGPEGPPDHYKSFYPSTSHHGTVFYHKGLLDGTA